jgi:transposase
MANKEFAMGARITLRDDFDAGTLRRLAKQSGDSNQTRRLLSLASIYDGGKRLEAARIGGVTLQIVRDWVLRFNAEGPEGLIDRKAPGAVPKLTAEHRGALARIVEAGPIPAVHGVVRWRIKDLVAWLHEELGVKVAESTVRGALKDMGFVKLTARPRHHGQNEHALEAFKKVSPQNSRPSEPVWVRRHR